MRTPESPTEAALTDWLTVSQASDELGIPSRTLHYRIKTGKIAATKMGGGLTNAYLIPRDVVERLKAEAAA